MSETKTELPTRDLAVDYYRVSGVVLIVLGHWLLSAVTFVDGAFGLQDPLADLPWTQWLTWPLQAVPVFFLAAGYASAVSWAHNAHDDGGSRQTWVRTRLSKALGPTSAYLFVISALIVVAGLSGAPPSVLRYAGWAVAMQLWFLAVYVIVVYLTPIAVAVHRVWGLWAPLTLGLCVVVVDVLSIAVHVPYVGWLNYLFCWGAMYQLGICWHAGMLAGRRAVTLAVTAAVALGLLVGVGPFPVSMISVAGQAVQNSSPPSVALLALGCLETGLAVSLGPALNRAFRGRRAQQILSVANTNVMALYLWHMVPVVVVAALLYPAGLMPQPVEGSLAWWGGPAALAGRSDRGRRGGNGCPVPDATVLRGPVARPRRVGRFGADRCDDGGRCGDDGLRNRLCVGSRVCAERGTPVARDADLRRGGSVGGAHSGVEDRGSEPLTGYRVPLGGTEDRHGDGARHSQHERDDHQRCIARPGTVAEQYDPDDSGHHGLPHDKRRCDAVD